MPMEIEAVKEACKLWIQEPPLNIEPSPAGAGCKICVALGVDSSRCRICIAKSSALRQIKALGGESIETEGSSASSAGGDGICVIKAVPRDDEMWGRIIARANSMKAEGLRWADASEPLSKTLPAAGFEQVPAAMAGVVRFRKKVPEAYIKGLLTRSPPSPVPSLSEDLLRKHPNLRVSTRAAAAAMLSDIEYDENILAQFFQKGYSMMEVEIEDCYYQ